MSDFERLRAERQLRTLEIEAAALDLDILGYRDSLRDLLDPMLSAADLKLKTAADMLLRAAAKQIELKSKLADIAKLKNMLGQ